jgi:chloramphenicol 3-O-phosphotransferase
VLGDFYEGHAEDGSITPEVYHWQTATQLEVVDLRIDTSRATPEECAEQVRMLFEDEPVGGALSQIAKLEN